MNNFSIDNYDKLKKISAFIGDPADLVTEDKTIVGAINEILEGGGSGYTTVSGSIINNSADMCLVNGASVASMPGFGTFIGMQIPVQSSATTSYEFITADNDSTVCCLMLADANNTPITNATCSGNITFSSDFQTYVYTGDFTLTIT